jgi:exopolysaccharide/PEP-CTERM locus tyrosine autokinase
MNLLERAILRFGPAEPDPVTPAPDRADPLPPEVATRRPPKAPARHRAPAVLPQAGTRQPAVMPAAVVDAPVTRIAPPVGAAGGPMAEPRRVRRPMDAVHLEPAALAARGLLSPDATATRLAGEFRVIKRPLLANAFGRDREPVARGRRIMVTSAFPGEGKTSTATNLALSLAAEPDLRVLLVDADVARPSLPALLGYRPGPGLVDLILRPDVDPELLVRPTSIERLSLLGAGRRHALLTELLASEATETVLAGLTDRYPDRVIVFDSPPMLPTTEARELASHMGQVVVVVAAGATPRAAVSEMMALLHSSPVVGMVFNKVRDAYGAGSYGYGDAYGYGHDGASG